MQNKDEHDGPIQAHSGGPGKGHDKLHVKLQDRMHDGGKDTRPWWRYGYLWLVLSGPAVVVVAALATGYIALRNQDPVVDQNYYRHGLEINKSLAAQRALLPGLEGRNHAATPVRPVTP